MRMKIKHGELDCPFHLIMVGEGFCEACNYQSGYPVGEPDTMFCDYPESDAAYERAEAAKWDNEQAQKIINKVILHLSVHYIIDARSRFFQWGEHIHVKCLIPDVSTAVKVGWSGTEKKRNRKARLCVDGLWFYLNYTGEFWDIDFGKLDARVMRRMKEAQERYEATEVRLDELADLQREIETMLCSERMDMEVIVSHYGGEHYVTLKFPWGYISMTSDLPWRIKSIGFEQNIQVLMYQEALTELIAAIGKYVVYPESIKIDESP